MRVISIVGPTAVGKTAFALQLAKVALVQKKYAGVDLISADSRQVYRGLEIVSGADVPDDLPYETTLSGVGLINPDQEWSVSHFQQYAQLIIERAFFHRRLPIIVGGTGLYHDRLFETDSQLHVGPNQEIRTKAEAMSVEQLQQWMQEVDPERFGKMNHSDQHNPRRLVRALEITLAAKPLTNKSTSEQKISHVYVGLIDDLEKIEQKIRKRVEERFKHGAVGEVERLVKTYTDRSLPAFSATGLREIEDYLEQAITEEECLEKWSLREFQYAKRQLTWWKNKNVKWFDINEKDWEQPAIVNTLGI